MFSPRVSLLGYGSDGGVHLGGFGGFFLESLCVARGLLRKGLDVFLLSPLVLCLIVLAVVVIYFAHRKCVYLAARPH